MWRVFKASMFGCGRLASMPLTLLSVVTPPLVAVTAVVLVWLEMRPQRSPLSTLCRTVVDRVVPDVLQDLQQHRSGLRTVLLLPLQFDPTGQVTAALRAAIEHTNLVVLSSPTLAERFRSLTNSDQVGTSSLHDAIELARGQGAMAALFGSVDRLEHSEQGAVLDLHLHLVRADDGAVLMNHRYVKELQPALLSAGETSSAVGLGTTIPRDLLLLGLAILLLPILSISFLARMVARRSNTANVLGLLSVGVIGAGVAHMLVAVRFEDGRAWLITGASFLITVVYTAVIANTIAGRRETVPDSHGDFSHGN